MAPRGRLQWDGIRSPSSCGSTLVDGSVASAKQGALHQRATHQDGRRVRRDCRRWTVERTSGALGNFRHLTIRDDRLMETYRGSFQLAYALITLRTVLK